MRIGSLPSRTLQRAAYRPRAADSRDDSPDRVTLTSSPAPAKLSSAAAGSALAAAIPGPVGLGLAEITVRQLDVNSVDAWDEAEKVYDEIRAQKDDVEHIAAHSDYSSRQVARIKAHLFYRDHQLDDRVGRFDASPSIANAWLRLDAGLTGPRDLQVLEHELFESYFEEIFHTDYRTAHAAANRSGRPSGLD